MRNYLLISGFMILFLIKLSSILDDWYIFNLLFFVSFYIIEIMFNFYLRSYYLFIDKNFIDKYSNNFLKIKFLTKKD